MIEEYKYLYLERVAIMTENGATEKEAEAQAKWEVRERMVHDGISFKDANLKIIGIAKNTP